MNWNWYLLPVLAMIAAYSLGSCEEKAPRADRGAHLAVFVGAVAFGISRLMRVEHEAFQRAQREEKAEQIVKEKLR